MRCLPPSGPARHPGRQESQRCKGMRLLALYAGSINLVERDAANLAIPFRAKLLTGPSPCCHPIDRLSLPHESGAPSARHGMGLGALLVDVRLDRPELHGPAGDHSGPASDQRGFLDPEPRRFRLGDFDFFHDLCAVPGARRLSGRPLGPALELTLRQSPGGRSRRSRRPSCRALGWLFVVPRPPGRRRVVQLALRLRVTARVLPPKDRSLGNGIFNSGAAVGAVLTPLVVTYLSPRVGWRGAFLVIGSLGFVWVGVWLCSGSRPAQRGCSPASRPKVADDPAEHRDMSAVVASGQSRFCMHRDRGRPPRPFRSSGTGRPRSGSQSRWRCWARSLVAGLLPRHELGGAEMGDQLARDRPAQAVLGSGRRLDLDQYLLALPGQLGADLSPD